MPDGSGEPVLHDMRVGSVSVWKTEFFHICLSTLWQCGIDKVQGDPWGVLADTVELLGDIW